MNKSIKVLFLVIAFVFPISIFVFLKLFGKNEFDVPALFTTEAPPAHGCAPVQLPYVVPDSIQQKLRLPADSLTVIFFETRTGEELNQRDRVKEQTASDPIQVLDADKAFGHYPVTNTPNASDSGASKENLHSVAMSGERIDALRRCVFFVRGDTNVVMLDKRGAIRGQYKAGDREEMDRLLTEVAILLRKY